MAGKKRGLIAVLAVTACAGEPRVLPPRAAPARSMPDIAIPEGPVPDRHGRVVLDTTDGPMNVAAKYDPTFVPPGGPPETTRSGELCRTPCIVDLPVGKYRLYFSATEGTDAAAGDTDDIQISEGVQVYRRAPGLYDTPSPTDQILPVTILVLSAIAIPVGAVMLASEDEGVAAGAVIFGLGIAGAIGGGIWAYDASRATRQEGASTIFVPGR